MKRLNLALVILIAISLLKLTFQQESSCRLDTSYKYFSTKTEYDLSANVAENSDDFKLEGCKSIGFWHLSRHGGRYPEGEDISTINEILPKIRDDILNEDNNSNWFCDEDLIKLSEWESRMIPEFDYKLTPNGKTLISNLGKRMRERLIDLMQTIRSEDQVVVKATELIRTRESAEEYTNTFLEDLVVKPFINQSLDYLLKFPDLCQSFIQNVDKNSNKACPEIKAFESKSLALNKTKEKFNSRLKLNLNEQDSTKIFELALKMCQYEYLIDRTDSIWCKFFDKEMLKTLEYKEDIKYNCKYGYRHDISRLMTCDLVKYLLQSLSLYKKGYENPNSYSKKVHLLFSHSSTMLPFFAAMGLSQNLNNFDYNNIEIENPTRNYRISYLDPMNSNMAFVLYKCDDQAAYPKYTLRSFHNENLVKPDGCDDFNCDLQKFIDHHTFFTDVCVSTENVCKID